MRLAVIARQWQWQWCCSRISRIATHNIVLKEDLKNPFFLKEKENLNRAVKGQPLVANEIPWVEWLESLDYVGKSEPKE